MRAGPSSARGRLNNILDLLDDMVLAFSFFHIFLLRHGT